MGHTAHLCKQESSEHEALRDVECARPVRIPRIRPNRRAAGGCREFESVSRVASKLARTADLEVVARTLLDEIAATFGVSFAGLTVISDDGREAVGYLARSDGKDADWWREVRL